MSLLGQVLPGVREVRAPTIAGYLWLVMGFLLVRPDLSNPEPASALSQSVWDLAASLSQTQIFVATTVVAYLVGSVAQSLFHAVATGLQPSFGSLAGAPSIVADPALMQAHIELDRVCKRYVNHGVPEGVVNEVVEPRTQVLMDELDRELASSATLLVGDQPMLFSEVDRLRGEAELRTLVGPPLLTLAGVLVWVISP